LICSDYWLAVWLAIEFAQFWRLLVCLKEFKFLLASPLPGGLAGCLGGWLPDWSDVIECCWLATQMVCCWLGGTLAERPLKNQTKLN